MPSLAAVPRKALVVVQFTVSIVLIIGTIVVYRQLQLAKHRPWVMYRQIAPGFYKLTGTPGKIPVDSVTN
jgi:hypothetical protein